MAEPALTTLHAVYADSLNREPDLDKNWHDIAAKARAIPEVHLIKMVYSCKWLFDNIENNELYRVACMNVLTEKNAHPAQIRWSESQWL